MGVRIERVDLPGIGVRNDIITEGGRRVSVVSLRSGERDLALFDAELAKLRRVERFPRHYPLHGLLLGPLSERLHSVR